MLFHAPPQSAPLNHIKVTQSLQGVAVPLVFGTTRVSGLLVFDADLVAHPESDGGKAKGGKSGQYAYTGTFICALCQGPILGVNAMWDQSGLLQTVPHGIEFNILAAPGAPTLSYVAGGALAARTYYVKLTYTDANGESAAGTEASIAVPGNDLVVVNSPAANGIATGWNVYIGSYAGSEVQINTSPLAIGSNYTEPTSGANGNGVPSPGQPIARGPFNWTPTNFPPRQDLGIEVDGNPFKRIPY